MLLALTLGFSRRELIDLNLTQIYLRVTTVSNISSADGITLHSWTWQPHGQRIPNRYGLLNFARQPPLTPAQLRLWWKLLRHLLAPHAASNNCTLDTPLGPPWTGPSHTTWGAFLFEETLYQQGPTGNCGKRHVAVW